MGILPAVNVILAVDLILPLKQVFIMGAANTIRYVARKLDLGDKQYRAISEVNMLRGYRQFEAWSVYGNDQYEELRSFVMLRGDGSTLTEIFLRDYTKCLKMVEFENGYKEHLTNHWVMPRGFNLFARRGNLGYIIPEVDHVFQIWQRQQN